MSERKPLTALHNGCSARRTVRRTYGRKGKASAVAGSQNFFIMVDELQTKMSRLDVSEIKEEDDKENVELPKSIKKPKAKKVELEVDEESEFPVTVADEQEDNIKSSTRRVSQSEYASMSPDEQAVLKFTKQFSDRGILGFQAYGKSVGEKYSVKKIGEGAFSSVFALTRRPITGSNTNKKAGTGHQTTIIKMMPISLPSMDDVEGTTKPDLIATELEAMKVMDSIHGFIRYRGVVVVIGNWPINFLEAFRDYKITHRANALNDDPEEAFGKHQFYALIEMEDAGKEVNTILRPSDFQMYDIFWSTCIHLANAEGQVQFEHRDLHISNVCIKSFDLADNRIDVDQSTVKDMQVFPDAILGMSNIATTIIDYTYSRVTPPIDDNSVQAPTIFRPADSLAEGQYDDLVQSFIKKRSAEKRDGYESRVQGLTYAKVTKCVDLQYDRLFDLKATVSAAVWETHAPRTNVCWLGYFIACLLQRAGKQARTKYVAGSNEVAKEVQDSIRAKLVALKECLMVEDVDELPKSATDVVRIGVERGWLRKEEIEAFKERLEEDS